jgi:hypothetical protein
MAKSYRTTAKTSYRRGVAMASSKKVVRVQLGAGSTEAGCNVNVELEFDEYEVIEIDPARTLIRIREPALLLRLPARVLK